MITTFGSEFDSAAAKSTSARVAVLDKDSAAVLRGLDADAAKEAEAKGREYSSFIVGETKDGTAPIVRVKITRNDRGYHRAEDSDAPATVADLDSGCSILLKASPFQWEKEDPKYGPKLGMTLYGNIVYCAGRIDNFKWMEADQPLKKREARWT